MFFPEALDHTIKKLRAQTANAITLANLTLGSLAILAGLNDQWSVCFIYIFLAALADRFDGMVARKLNIESKIGKQLDSMCDIISFGLAPALLLYQLSLQTAGLPGMFFTVLFIGCGAFRLARFNTSEGRGYFTGLPITAAGCLLTLSSLGYQFFPPAFYLCILFILSIMMVSSFKIKKI